MQFPNEGDKIVLLVDVPGGLVEGEIYDVHRYLGYGDLNVLKDEFEVLVEFGEYSIVRTDTDDRLDQIFAMQNVLDSRIILERDIEKSTDEWVIGLTLAMESEIDEIRREVNWKWWKNPKEIDKTALQGEVIDMWHFLVSLSEKVGLTADDVYRVYCEKNAENHTRQSGNSDKDGYEVEGNC